MTDGWLVSLATAKGQTVLDPFAGSGTTCKAAKNKSRQFIGIEEQPKWADVARVRSGLPPVDHSHIRSDDAQHGLEQF
ncbi:adenine DNA methyltransferase [environmental Halophage eHP-9]|nr:adenine DNA methyltransferase [environmental Halophage eHP-9]